jgi:hypothetical protein
MFEKLPYLNTEICTPVLNTLGVIKNAPLRKKYLKLWRFLAVVYNVVFCFLFLFFWPRKMQICMWKDNFFTQHTVATTEGHEVTRFFKSGFFYKMPGQNKNKGS